MRNQDAVRDCAREFSNLASELEHIPDREPSANSIDEKVNRLCLRAVEQLGIARKAGVSLIEFAQPELVILDSLNYWLLYVMPRLKTLRPSAFSDHAGAYNLAAIKTNPKGQALGKSGKQIKKHVEYDKDGNFLRGWWAEEPGRVTDGMDSDHLRLRSVERARDSARACKVIAEMLGDRIDLDEVKIDDWQFRPGDDRYTILQLREFTNCGNTTINKYMHEAGVKVGPVGDKSYTYSRDEVVKVLRHFALRSTHTKTVEKCQEAIEKLTSSHLHRI